MHTLRKSKSFDCPTCGAVSHKPCRMATPVDPYNGQEPSHADDVKDSMLAYLNKDMNSPKQIDLDLPMSKDFEIQFLQYNIALDIKRLRELNPEHELVRVVSAYLKYQNSRSGDYGHCPDFMEQEDDPHYDGRH